MTKTGTPSRQLFASPIDRASEFIASSSIHFAKHSRTLIVLLTFCCAPAFAAAQDMCTQAPIFSAGLVYDRNGRPMVQAKIEGEDRYLLLDTGGARSILDPDSAIELGLRVEAYSAPSESLFERGAAAPLEEYIDVTGRRSSSIAVVDELRLGARNFGSREFVVSPIGQNQDDRFSPVGTLGSDFMMAYDVAFDFGAHVVQLFAHNQCSIPPFPESGEAETSIPVPFTFNRSNHINFPLRLDGQMLMAVLDTGAHDTILSLPVAQRIFSIDLDGPDVIQAGELDGRNVVNLYRRRFSLLQIEMLMLVDPMIFLLPDLMASSAPNAERMLLPASEESTALPEFILGMSVLGRYRLFISYGRRIFFLSPVPSG